jgi:hypothetical protein
MPTIKLLIVSNGCNWQSWPQKITDLTAFFKSVCNLEITLQQTSFTNIPFLTFGPRLTQYENYPAGAKVMDVNQSWYTQNIVPLAKGYDIVLFTLPLSTWPLNDIVRGVTQLATKNPVQIQVAADESEAVYVNMQKLFDSFEHYAEHEIMHALFALSKATDTTHYWDFAKANLAGALADLNLTSNLPTQTLLQYLFAKLSALLEKIKNLKPMPQDTPTTPQTTPPIVPAPAKPVSRIHVWALAIAVQEGAKKGLNNPGNLKVSTLTKSWGATNGFQATDGGWIAAFPTLEAGEIALENFLTLGAENELKAFHEARTLHAFTNVYAGNPPAEYPQAVARALGVVDGIDVSELL